MLAGTGTLPLEGWGGWGRRAGGRAGGRGRRGREGAAARLSHSSGGCLQRRNSCAATVPRPEQQPKRRCQAVTCLIPAGKLARANFCRSLDREVARTSGSAEGPGPGRAPPCAASSLLAPAARARGLSPARALSLRPPPSSGPLRAAQGGGCRETPTRAAWTCTVSSGLRGRAHAVTSAALCLLPACLACDPGPGLWRRFGPRLPEPAWEPDHRQRSSDGNAEPPPRLKPECPEARAKQAQAKETQAAKARARGSAAAEEQEEAKAERGPPKKWWWWASWPWRRLSPARSSGKRDKPASARNPTPASVSAAPVKARPAATKTS